ncbi:MAG TPA: FtsX-like permease family protein [Rhodothermales bacterium]|nr:FtsX-like permease family protein [Rhodothermales bacterium]
MLRNYLTLALRNLRRHAGYATINLVGLAVGIACFLLVFLYLQHEYSFDTYHEKGDRIYRIVGYSGFGEKSWQSHISGDPIAEMRGNYIDVVDATKITRCGTDRIQLLDEVYPDIDMLCAESNLFNIFSFHLQQGNPASVLDRPNTAVITRSLAERLFGKENPVGKTLPIRFIGEDQLFEITGLMADVPKNTHFTFDLALSYSSLESKGCLNCGNFMYALLAPDADLESVAGRVLTHVRKVDGRENVEDIRLEPLRDIHFSEIYAERQGDKQYVYLLSAIALVILLIACANYMNLATARSIRRTQEIGVRKVVGAHRGQIMRQFLLETLLLTLLALPLALLLLVLALPTFNTLAETDVTLAWRGNLVFLGMVAGIIVLVGLVAGSYPALFLSKFQPVEVLRGRLPSGHSGVALRRVLVVFQFAASIVLLISTIVILRQLDFMQHKKLGFDAEQVLVVTVTDPLLAQQPDVLKEGFLQQANVLQATASFAVPGETRFQGIRLSSKPFGKDGPTLNIITPAIDADFLETMKIPLLAGRNISKDIAEGRQLEALINEATMKAMQWKVPEDAIGEEIERGKVIVGVVPDFHFQSLHQKIEPLMMLQNRSGQAWTIALRLAGGDIPATLDVLEATWQETGTAMPFEFSFLTDELTQLYESEQRTAKIFGLFAGLAILIACLGLLGLAAFTAAQRTKEIGIRKVLGATISGIVVLLTKDFLKLVALAFVIAVPAAYVAAQRWLEDFAFRIDLSWTVFLLAGAAAVVVAVLSVGYQSVRAALTNPVHSLRHE